MNKWTTPNSVLAITGFSLACFWAALLVSPEARGNEQILKSFGFFQDSASYAAYPTGGLVQGTNGMLYGVAGTVFKLNPDGTGFSVVHSFANDTNGASQPMGPLALSIDGAFYGVGWEGTSRGAFIFRLNGDGSEYRVIHRLDASINLSDWVTVGTIFNERGAVQFFDANATKAPQRFYRAVWLP